MEINVSPDLQNLARGIKNIFTGGPNYGQPIKPANWAPSSTPITPANTTPIQIGTQAKAPEQNISKPKTSISPSQIKQTLPKMATTKSLSNTPLTGPIKNTGISTANPSSMANNNYINALYKEAYGRDATANEQAKFTNKSVKDSANLILGTRSPFTSTVSQSKTLEQLAAEKAAADKAKQDAINKDISSKGLLTNLNTEANTGSPIAALSETGLLNTASGENPATGGEAGQAYQSALDEIKNITKEYNDALSGLGNSGKSAYFQSGAGQVMQNQYNARLNAAQNKALALQNLMELQNTGIQTQQSGFSQAGNLAQTGQGLKQSGISTAAGLAQPVQVPYGTPLVNPQTGQVLGGTETTSGQVSPTDPFYKTMQSYAQLLATNQGSAVPSSITGNPVLNAQVIQMAKEINPNYNVNVSSGAASAQAETAATQAGTIEGYKSAVQQGQNLQSQLNNLISSLGLNPSDINKVNQGLQVIAQNTSDPRYQILSNYINDIANTYAQVLTPPGGSATNQTREIATSMLDSSMSGQGIIDVMKSLDAAAQAKIAGVATTGGIGTQNSTGGTVSAGGFNFIKDANGNWVVSK